MTATYATAHAAYLDNADYDVEGSLAKAKLFAVACRRLIHLTTTASNTGEGSLEDEPRKYRDELRAAKAWIASHPDSAPVRHVNFANFRA